MNIEEQSKRESGLSFYVAADTGGTFTDVVAFDRAAGVVHFGKTLTTYANLVDGVVKCVGDLDIACSSIDVLKHGTTHIINAFVQRRGANAALVTTRGFRDVLEIGRANRPIGFDLGYAREAPLVPRTRAHEIGGRLDAHGRELEPIDPAEVTALGIALASRGVDAVAVSLVNAYVDPVHEYAVADLLRRAMPDAFVTTGAELTREWSEFERASTAVANAYVGPRAREYLDRFGDEFRRAGFDRTFYMMASNGGVLSPRRAAEQPVALLESGPVGGCIGAGIYAQALGLEKVIAFDMGGTTAKCALVESGQFEVQPTYYVGGYERGFPVRSPILDIVEVGAGGGSIAHVDAQGRLHVGPRSAGSEPGPVAFGRGGTEPTVTDANVVLGRIGTGAFMGGALRLDAEAARSAIAEHVAAPLGYDPSAPIETVAAGILAIASATMAGAIKEITIERGHDAREFDLFVFGGGGPLHGASLARELHIPRVIVPPQPGNFSALGMLLAAARIDETRTFVKPLDDEQCARMAADFVEIEAAIAHSMRDEAQGASIRFLRSAELRYRGQKHSLKLEIGERPRADSLAAAFHELYAQRYGHADEAAPVEFVALRSTGFAAADRVPLESLHTHDPARAPELRWRDVYHPSLGRRAATRVYDRATLPVGFAAEGPAIVEDYGSTIVIEPQDRFDVGRLGEITIHCA